MSIVLNPEELLDAAYELLPKDEFQVFVKEQEACVRKLAERLASVTGVTLFAASFEGGFGGTMATFKPGPNGETSDVLASFDEGGDWE